tara:strand:- start:337 stop:540 length:204 start_codon:yes stop_codon:yes gene_type:complete
MESQQENCSTKGLLLSVLSQYEEEESNSVTAEDVGEVEDPATERNEEEHEEEEEAQIFLSAGLVLKA